MLPGIDIEFQNGALGQFTPSPDGVYGLIANMNEITGFVEHFQPILVTSLVDVAALGIADTLENHRVYKFLQEFYAEAGRQELLILPLPKINGANPYKMSIAFTPDATTGVSPAEVFLKSLGGKIRGLFTVFNPEASYDTSGIVLLNGMDQDVLSTATLANTVAQNFTENEKAPLFVLLEAYGFTGDVLALPELGLLSLGRVGIVIGDTESRDSIHQSYGSAMGVLAGRSATTQVHVNPGKVRLGALKPLEMFVVNKRVEVANITALHDKGFITFRNHVGKSGYFVSDDPMVTEISDDYHYLTHRRVVDKAYRIAYITLLDFLLDDISLTNTGTIMPSYAKMIEGRVVRAIGTQMTALGELSSDEANQNDAGCIIQIDLTHNMASTSRLKFAKFQVRPKGHARYIDVPLGFVPVTNN